jgi:hypothetical protein
MLDFISPVLQRDGPVLTPSFADRSYGSFVPVYFTLSVLDSIALELMTFFMLCRVPDPI